jgi:enoyl-[acyl-carrier-protein] reductase (NADH)
MGKRDGKVAVTTGATAGMALAGAKLFVDEGAHVFITGRRQDAMDEAVKQIGHNVTGVQGDAADLDDLDRLYDTVKQEKGSLDVLWPARVWASPPRSARSPRPTSTPRSGSTPAAPCSPPRRPSRSSTTAAPSS